MARNQKAIHPDDDIHYEKLGLIKDKVQLFEDGLRTKGKKGEYEWWYFDNHYEDGTIVVIFFFTKSPIQVQGDIKPLCTIEITRPDGTKISEQVSGNKYNSFYQKDRCDIKINTCRCSGNLAHYEVLYRGKTVSAKLTLDATIPSWRSQSGSIIFGDKEKHYFSWLPAVPEGKSVIELSINGERLCLQGSGYHDHNWGNISMMKLMHHWYWGRAKIGDYNVISSWITSEKKYGYKEFDVFMFAKNNQIIGDNRNHTLKFLPSEEYIDKHTGKKVYGTVCYEYQTENDELYRITYKREKDIASQNFIDVLPRTLRFFAKLAGVSGSYIRFSGTATIEKIIDGKVVESVQEPSAVWELMYFGKNGKGEKAQEINQAIATATTEESDFKTKSGKQQEKQKKKSIK